LVFLLGRKKKKANLSKKKKRNENVSSSPLLFRREGKGGGKGGGLTWGRKIKKGWDSGSLLECSYKKKGGGERRGKREKVTFRLNHYLVEKGCI